jgi:hypothetical protein
MACGSDLSVKPAGLGRLVDIASCSKGCIGIPLSQIRIACPFMTINTIIGEDRLDLSAEMYCINRINYLLLIAILFTGIKQDNSSEYYCSR